MANRFDRISETIREEIIKEESKVRNGVRLFIPTICDKIILTKDWFFMLQPECKNRTLFEKWAIFSGKKYDLTDEAFSRYCYDGSLREQMVCLPVGTILFVDRIYMKGRGKEMRKYDSITFRILKKSLCKELIGARFWANIKYINQIECDLYKPED